MKKINYNEEDKYAFSVSNQNKNDNTTEQDDNLDNKKENEDKEYIDIANLGDEKKDEEVTYKEIDPKKRFRFFIIIIIAIVFTVTMLLVNAQLTKTRTSSTVDSLPSSQSNDAEDNNQEDAQNVIQSYVPNFSIYDNWIGENNAFALKLSKDNSFVYSERVDKDVYTYYGTYQVLYSEEAAMSAGLDTETACEIFHISEEDYNPSNLIYLNCVPTKYKINNNAYKDISNTLEKNGDESDIFTHLMYIADDLNGQVKMTYYDETSDTSHVLIQSKNVPTTTKANTSDEKGNEKSVKNND